MRFLQTNLVTESATTITASSANVNFPASNLSNPFRSKRWRSSGTFVVGSTNNKINFKEADAGTELTATIPDGTYSTTTLATAIKTQLESVGSETYTVSYSTATGLWTIASSGAYLSLLNTTGTNAGSSLLKNSLGFSSSDLTGSTTYTGSLVAIHTKESVVFDLKTIQNINSVVLLWPKEDGIRLSSTAVLKLEANATNEWSNPAVSETLTIDDNYLVASKFFTEDQEYRYWRITVEDPQNPFLYIELGMVWIGENVEFREPENGFKFGLEDTTKISRNEFGHEYADEYPTIATLEFNYSYIEYQTAQALENAFRKNGIRKPVLVVLDEEELVFNKDHFLIYGKLGRDFSLNHVSYNLFSGGLKITELG